MIYSCGVLTNLANYRSLGNFKFIPGAPVGVFEGIIKSSSAYKKDPQKIMSLWNSVKVAVYSLTDREKTLGFPDNVNFFISFKIILWSEKRSKSI